MTFQISNSLTNVSTEMDRSTDYLCKILESALQKNVALVKHKEILQRLVLIAPHLETSISCTSAWGLCYNLLLHKLVCNVDSWSVAKHRIARWYISSYTTVQYDFLGGIRRSITPRKSPQSVII